jgi:hypothetical protein
MARSTTLLSISIRWSVDDRRPIVRVLVAEAENAEHELLVQAYNFTEPRITSPRSRLDTLAARASAAFIVFGASSLPKNDQSPVHW